MSVVNDMLKDLDAQQQNNTASDVELMSVPLPDDDKLGKKAKDASHLWSVASAFLIFFAILGGYYYWQFTPEVVEEQAVEVKPTFDEVLLNAEVIEVLDKEADEVLLNIDKAENTVGAFEESVITDPPPKQNQVVELIEVPDKPVVTANVENHIQFLLDAGDKAFKADRLQTPKEDNAYDRYIAVLALQPKNSIAQQGVEKIQQRYLGFIQSVIAKGQYYKVPDLVKKARDVGVRQEDIDVMLSKLPVAKSQPVKDVIKHLEEKKVAGSAGGVELAESKGVVEKSFNSRDLQKAQEAARNMAEGRMLIAETQLTEFVEENPQSIFAFQKLFDLYLLQQRLQDAEAMAEKGSHLPGELFSYMIAQVLTRRGDLEGGLRALNSHSPSMGKFPGYYALKAGLLHKLEQNQKAIELYQKLISQDPHNPSYWLGLAVSMDAVSAPQTLQVFQQVYKIAPENAPYMDYIQQRIQALDPTVPAGNDL